MEEYIPLSAKEAHEKDSRIRWSKEWSREKIPRSGSQKKRAEKRFQDQVVKSGQGKYHKMHFVRPPRRGHILYSLRIKHHHKSLANFLSCIIANLY
jgi:hypothetical protein